MTDRLKKIEENDIESQPTFEDALEELQTDDESMPSPALILGLSGLSSAQIQELAPVWENLSESYRRILMQMLVDAAISNFELDFNPIGHAALHSPQADVRQAAIELLWEDESIALLEYLTHIAQSDEIINVRAEAVKALGRFVLLGEMGDLEENTAITIQDILMRIIENSGEDILVRRFAIESIANCTRKGLRQTIAEAYRSTDSEMRLSAIIAMGRSYDSHWENDVLEELSNPDEDTRIAAIRSAGKLQLSEGVGQIIKNIEDGDREEQEVAIWSLGEIGGKEAVRILESLQEGAENVQDIDLLDLIDEAIGTASLVNGDFGLLDFTNLDD